MRKLGLSLALLAGAAAPVAAQQMWQPEIGIRAGWTRFDDPNSSGTIDIIDLPSVGGLSATINPSALYGIVPLSGRFALQPNFSFYNTVIPQAVPQVATVFSTGVRLNVAITKDFYAAAGPNVYILKADGNEDTQGAIEAAVGYRRPFGSRLRGTAEAFYEKREKSEALPKLNLYGLRIGMGYAFGEGTISRRAGRATMETTDRMWTPAIGLQGGWSMVSYPGGNGDFSTFSLPFTGQTLIGTLAQVPTPSALSILLPVGDRFAIEPNVDFHRLKASSLPDPISSYEIGARVNYAFTHVAYAALGAEFSGISAGSGSVTDGSSVAVLAALGLRFPLVHGLKGRTEINYRTFDGTDVHPGGQMTSFVFGILVPVK
jgi:hypothetical protein